MSEKKKRVEDFLMGANKPRRRLEFGSQGNVDENPTAITSLSYTFCWDNTQIEIKARHETTQKNVKVQLWALCYMAVNRVSTDNMSDSVPEILATDIPVAAFLPSPDHEIALRGWLAFHIKTSLVQNLPAFHRIKKRVSLFIKHEHWEQIAKRSEIINLGVLDENSSTTDGAIGIMEFLSERVPLYPDGRPYSIITHCDGGAFERMVGARRVRAPDRGPIRQLLGVEPSAQEFHKRGLLLQLIMDKYFKGASQSERGTLANIKVVMGRHSVKAKVMDAFNHVESMFDMVCDGQISLFAMQLLGMESLEDIPEKIFDQNDLTEVEELLNETVEAITDAIWLQPTEEQIYQVTNALVSIGNSSGDICCGQDVPGDVILCSNPHCPNGGNFHAMCITAVLEDVPSSDDDWWCSLSCEGWSRFCSCKKHIDDSEMVECAKGKLCQHGQWFHVDCVGLHKLPDSSDVWHCSSCKSLNEETDGVYQYSIGLLWMLLNDRLRRTAIREGNGYMLMEWWKDDGIHFWNENHNKYLVLMHRMVAGQNGWLPERQAYDMMWNRTVNLQGGAGRNVAMDKVNESMNNDFKTNLKHTGGKYTEAQVLRSSFLMGGMATDLDNLFATNVAGCKLRQAASKKDKQHSAVTSFIKEYEEDSLFANIPDRQHGHFPNFSAKNTHQRIKKPVDYKKRLLSYSTKLDRGRYASTKFTPSPVDAIYIY